MTFDTASWRLWLRLLLRRVLPSEDSDLKSFFSARLPVDRFLLERNFLDYLWLEAWPLLI